MYHIETYGSPRQMGQQIGDALGDQFDRIIDRYAPWIRGMDDRRRAAVAALRDVTARHAPEVLEETAGMAEAVGMDEQELLGLRMFNEVKHYMPSCSGLVICDSDRGPLLARTCDLEPDISQEIQLSRVSRPNEGPATVTVTYLPMVSSLGFNEHGIAMTGSSAVSKGDPAMDGLPMAVLNTVSLKYCKSLEDVAGWLTGKTLRGKGAIQLFCDAAGRSMIAEYPTGRETILTHRAAGDTYQACTNFPQTAGLELASGPLYAANAYARFGRMKHQADGDMPRTLEGVKQLLVDVAQPGMVCPAETSMWRTAYAFVIEVRNRKMHLAPGHPAEVDWMEISL